MLKKPLVNNRIRAKEVRLIDETGNQIGVVSLGEALEKAKEKNLDLIQVSSKVEPPVCKLGDFGKYQYLQEKKEKESKKHKKTSELKGIRLTYKISQHDLDTKARQAEKFLNKGDKVRIELPLKGREKALEGYAREKINNFLESLKEKVDFKTEKELKKEPRGLTIIISKN